MASTNNNNNNNNNNNSSIYLRMFVNNMGLSHSNIKIYNKCKKILGYKGENSQNYAKEMCPPEKPYSH
jgi:hypothetical protein